MKTFVTLFMVTLSVLALGPLRAQPAPAAPGAPNFSNSAAQAVDLAKDSVDPSLRDRVVSVYGVGSPSAIAKWWVIFYDPSVPSHGRAVKIVNGQVTKAYEAKGGVVYSRELTFPRSWVTGEGGALAATQNYAAQHAITYDTARALLRLTSSGQALRWRVEMMSNGNNQGFVFANASDGTFAMYSPPGSVPSSTSASTGGLVGDAKRFGNDVKNTFLGIGGDLQEFFTGERTVDQ